MLHSAVISKSASKIAEHTPGRTYHTIGELPVWNQKSCNMTPGLMGDYVQCNLIPNYESIQKTFFATDPFSTQLIRNV
jgi:hypothetical protein